PPRRVPTALSSYAAQASFMQVTTIPSMREPTVGRGPLRSCSRAVASRATSSQSYAADFGWTTRGGGGGSSAPPPRAPPGPGVVHAADNEPEQAGADGRRGPIAIMLPGGRLQGDVKPVVRGRLRLDDSRRGERIVGARPRGPHGQEDRHDGEEDGEHPGPD